MTERKRSYKVGSRRKDLQKGDARMSAGRWAWVRNHIGQFVILVDDSDEEDPGTGRTIRLFHPKEGRPGISWNLTSLTEDELLKMKQLIDSAFEWALPIVQARDKEAQRAFQENGDDSYTRLYRQVPQLVYRKRPEHEHGEGLLDRPEGLPSVDQQESRARENGNPDRGSLRGSGDAVAERDSTADLAKDNWPTVDQPPSLCPMDGTPGPTTGLQAADPSEGPATPDTGGAGRTGEDATQGEQP